MKNFFFGLISLYFLSNNLNAQNSITNSSSNTDEYVVALNENTASEVANLKKNDARLRCRKINVGFNVLFAWASTDIYIICGYPESWLNNNTGCIVSTNEADCDFVNGLKQKDDGLKLNLKDIFKETDVTKVESLEIAKGETWVDEDGTKKSIRLGKYPVDKEGYFELEILIEK